MMGLKVDICLVSWSPSTTDPSFKGFTEEPKNASTGLSAIEIRVLLSEPLIVTSCSILLLLHRNSDNLPVLPVEKNEEDHCKLYFIY